MRASMTDTRLSLSVGRSNITNIGDTSDEVYEAWTRGPVHGLKTWP